MRSFIAALSVGKKVRSNLCYVDPTGPMLAYDTLIQYHNRKGLGNESQKVPPAESTESSPQKQTENDSPGTEAATSQQS